MAEENERQPVREMTDRELLEESCQNMRDCFDMFTHISSAVQSGGIMGLLKGGIGGK